MRSRVLSFGGLIHVICQVASVLHDFMVMVETCLCHSPLIKKWGSSVPDDLYRRWVQCPCRGQMGAWFASGECFRLLQSLMRLQSAELAVQLPSDLSESDRSACLWELERARSHIVTAVVIKNAYMTQPPFLILAIAHHDKTIARSAWERCVASDCDHPQVHGLESEVMQREAATFFCWGGRVHAFSDLPGIFAFCLDCRATRRGGARQVCEAREERPLSFCALFELRPPSD